MYVYKSFEPGLWTVGYYTPGGKWEPESDHNTPDAAAARVTELNGGAPATPATASPLVVAVLEAYYSKRDRGGNCNWAFLWTDTQDGRQVRGKISGGESNIRGIIFEHAGKKWAHPSKVHFTCTELPIRDFNRLVKDWKYAGCTPVELLAFIRAELLKQKQVGVIVTTQSNAGRMRPKAGA